MVWPKCLRWREGEEPEAQASLPSLFTGGSGVPVCCAVFGETGQGGGNAVSDPPLQTQHHRNLLCSKSRCCFDGRSELHRLFLCQRAHHDAEVILPNTVWSVYSKIRCFTMFNFLFLFFFLQFTKFKAPDRHQLPATDRHANSQDVLLLQPRSSPVPHVSDWDPEDYLQPGNLWQPAGQISVTATANVCVTQNNSNRIVLITL